MLAAHVQYYCQYPLVLTMRILLNVCGLLISYPYHPFPTLPFFFRPKLLINIVLTLTINLQMLYLNL